MIVRYLIFLDVTYHHHHLKMMSNLNIHALISLDQALILVRQIFYEDLVKLLIFLIAWYRSKIITNCCMPTISLILSIPLYCSYSIIRKKIINVPSSSLDRKLSSDDSEASEPF